MSVSIDEELARDLIQNKLRDIDDTISKILKKWDFENIEDFISGSKSGKLSEESIDDAIDIQNLTNKRDEISSILEK